MSYSRPREEWESTITRNKLTAAQEKLAAMLEGESRNESPRMQLLYSLIVAMNEYSASSNEIAGLKGLGLTETLELADTILSNETINERTVAIQTYRLIAKSIVL